METVVPRNHKLITAGTEVCRIVFRSSSAVSGRECLALHYHILRVSDICVAAEVEPSSEHREIDSDIIGVYLLPRDVRRIWRRLIGIINFLPLAETVIQLSGCADGLYVVVVSHCTLVSEGAIGIPEFQVIDHTLRIFEERLLTDSPSEGE